MPLLELLIYWQSQPLTKRYLNICIHIVPYFSHFLRALYCIYTLLSFTLILKLWARFWSSIFSPQLNILTILTCKVQKYQAHRVGVKFWTWKETLTSGSLPFISIPSISTTNVSISYISTNYWEAILILHILEMLSI